MAPIINLIDRESLMQHARRLADAMARAAQTRQNEAQLRHDVEPVISRALEALYGFSLEQIRIEHRNAGGNFDGAYGGVIVEYEWNMDTARRRHGARQALDYLAGERELIGATDVFTAVVTDGRLWGFLSVDEQDAEGGLELFTVPIDDPLQRFTWLPNTPEACRRFLELVGSNRRQPVTGPALVAAFGPGSQIGRELVSRFINSIQNRAQGDRIDTLYTEWRRSLDIAFGPEENANPEALRSVRDRYQIAVPGELREVVFALHTYFALVCRLLASEVLAISLGDTDSRPSQWAAAPPATLAAKLQELEAGSVPRGLSIGNLFEGDVFSWYLDRLQANLGLLGPLARMCSVLDEFAFPRLAFGSAPTADLFRELYHGLTPRELRGALGEFLTPEWLAQYTLEAAKRNGADLDLSRTLDCTCGTGTFLRPILIHRLHRLRQREGTPTRDDVQDVLNSVVGVDINPVAVVAARMNYLMALGDLATIGPLYIPVWLADSILLPYDRPVQRDMLEEGALAGTRYVELQTSLDEPFRVPVEFSSPESQDALSKLSGLLRIAVSNEYLDAEFEHALAGRFGPESQHPISDDPHEWENVRAVLLHLFQQLSRLHREGRDEVWAEVIENRFAPVFIGHFALVVGNPPWLSYKKLPDAWRRRAEPLWRDYGLFRVPDVPGVDPVRNFQASDMAVLVTAVALARYLRDGGTLAFVTPKGLIQSDAASRAFRMYHLSSERDPNARQQIDIRFRLLEVDDFSAVQPFAPDATNNPVVLVIRKGEEAQFPVPGSRWSKRGTRSAPSNISWDVARAAYLVEEPIHWTPISTYLASPLAWWRSDEVPIRRPPSTYTFGMGYNTGGAKGVYHVELLSRTDPQRGMIRVANIPDEGRLRSINRIEGEVESRLIVPAFSGQDIRPFSITPSAYVLLPHDPQDRRRPLTAHEIQSPQYQGTYAFLRNFKQQLLRRSPYPQRGFAPSEDNWWQMDSCDHLGPGDFRVCVKEIGTRVVSAVIRDMWDDSLGRVDTPIPNHKVVFYQTAVEGEAYYLAGILNSASVHDLLVRYANAIALSPAIRYLPMPPYDANNQDHVRIRELSRRAHDVAGTPDFDTISPEIDIAVAALLTPTD